MKPAEQKPRFRPETFGKFTLIAPIATGGMGELFLARMRADSGFERLVVIKRILPHLTDKPEFVNMFVDEARVAAQIHHPNVCQILEFGQIEGRYYMALEYLEGISMTQVIVAGREHDKLRSLRFLIAIMTQVCEGLHFAHNLRTPAGALAGVVHRDVNPRNIFVTSAGVAKVIDFGIVKALGAINVTRTGSVKGTYSYMSPEQIKATAVDRRSDVFSLGTVTWEAITGVRLFKRENDFHTWRAITEDPIPPPSQFREGLPEGLDNVFARALEREKGKRYATAREFGQALETALESSGGPLTPVAVAARIESAFEEEFVRQQKRTHAPSVLEDDDDEPSDAGDFIIRAEATGSNSQASPVTPSAHRGQPALFDTPDSSSGVSASDHHPLAGSTPITASDLGPVPQSPVPASLGPVPITQSDVPLAAPNALAMLEESAPELDPVAVAAPPSARRSLVPIALLFIAAIFTLAAVLYVTRSKPDANPTQAAAASGEGDSETEPGESDTTENPSPTTPVIEPPNEEDVAAKEREERERAAAEKVAAEKAAAEKAEKAKKEKAKKEKERAAREEKEKEREREKEKERLAREKEKERAKLPPGTLRVRSLPYGTVYIDGRKRGISPLKLTLKPGTYRVKVITSAGEDSRTVRIESKKESRARFKFD